MAEFFKAISGQAVEAAAQKGVRLRSNDPTRAMFLFGPKLVEVDLCSLPLRIEAYDLCDFAKLLDVHEATAVFVRTVSVDDETDRPVAEGVIDWDNADSIVFETDWHPLLLVACGQAWGSDDWTRPAYKFDQASILRWLTHDLGACVDSKFAQLFRVLRASSGVSRQMPGIGKERGTQEFSVEAAGELPETFVVRVPVLSCYEEFGVDLKFSLHVDVNTSPVSIWVRPLAGEIDRVRNEALRQLRHLICELSSESSKWADYVLLGKPTDRPRDRVESTL